jgi:hypothetical protein
MGRCSCGQVLDRFDGSLPQLPFRDGPAMSQYLSDL